MARDGRGGEEEGRLPLPRVRRDGGHQAHHVDDDPARFLDLANLLTLCLSCHREAEWRRKDVQALTAHATVRGERHGPVIA